MIDRGYWKTEKRHVWVDVPVFRQGDYIVTMWGAGCRGEGVVIGFNAKYPDLVIYATEQYHGSTTSVWNCELVSRGHDYKQFLQRWIEACGAENIIDQEPKP